MPAKRNQQQQHEESSSEEGRQDMLGSAAPETHKFLDVQYSKKFMASLPEKIRQRAEVLMLYHDEYQQLQATMRERETALRRKYDALYEPIYRRRQEIITGTGAPITDEEVKKGFPAEHESKVSLTADGDDNNNKKNKEGDEKDEKGLPGFWLRVLQHHVVLNSMIEPHDEEILKHLTNISSCVVKEGGYGSFAVTFSFAPNDYLVETDFTLTVVIDEDNARIERSPLTWKPGKDVTVKRVTKKMKSKRTKEVRTITSEEDQPSFFTIFRAPDKDAKATKAGKKGPHHNKDDEDEDEDDEEDEDSEEELANLLQVLHDSIIPGAVNYYTGEAPDGSSDVEDDEEDDEDDDEDEESEDDKMDTFKDQHMMRAAMMGGRRGGSRA